MFSTTLLPVGFYQVWHSFTNGLWYARSAAFYELPLAKALAQWRMVPDLIIIVVGALPLLYFLFATFRRLRKTGLTAENAEKSE